MGDFNLLVNPEDKNNAVINQRMMARFRALLNSLELKELYLNGRRYTWSNERRNPTLEKIDHIFVTNSWEDCFPRNLLMALGTAFSAHSPIFVDLDADFLVGKRFKFESFWPRFPHFLDTIDHAWSRPVHSSCAFKRLSIKMARTAKDLKIWSSSLFNDAKIQFHIATEIILRLDIAQESRSLSTPEFNLRRLLK